MRTHSKGYGRNACCWVLIVACFSPMLLMANKKRDEDRGSEKSLRAETSDRYLKKWVRQDVKYIITSKEKRAFKALTTFEVR